jgi:uncharacterized protein DUF5995
MAQEGACVSADRELPEQPDQTWGNLRHDMLIALAAEPDDIEGVVDQLNQVQDVLKRIPPLYDENPVADFNSLYTTITVNLGKRHKAGEFSRPAFTNRLIVEFSRLYLRALRQWSVGSPLTPQSWAVLFRRVSDTELGSLPCAAAGVNAHINYDLPFALKATWEYLGHCGEGSPQHRDYLLVNEVFRQYIPTLRSRYLDGWQKFIDRINLRIDDWYQNFFVVVTRNRAWERGQRLWDHRGDSGTIDLMRRSFDVEAARIGRALLSPFCRFIQ